MGIWPMDLKGIDQNDVDCIIFTQCYSIHIQYSVHTYHHING